MRERHPLPNLLAALAILAGAFLALLATSRPAWSDDTVLFRKNAGKPYVWVFFDTSTSMNLAPGASGDRTVDADADDPRSLFYQARQAVLQVFNNTYLQNGDLVHFGFAGYNQDNLHVVGKHWLYKVTAGTPLALGSALYPDPSQTSDQLQTLGTLLPASATVSGGPVISATGVLGTCAAGVTLNNSNRPAIARFPKLEPTDANGDGIADVGGANGATMYLTTGGKTYKIVAGLDPTSRIDDVTVLVHLSASTVDTSCNATPVGETTVTLSRVTAYFMTDEKGVDTKTKYGLGNGNSDEATGGIWNWTDVRADATCGDDQHPFTGTGWEGNYDSLTDSEATALGGTSSFPDVDPFFYTGSDLLKHSVDVKFPTFLYPTNASPDTSRPELRVLDSGDMLPYNWTDTNRVPFFERMAPDWNDGVTTPADVSYGVAGFFRDVPNRQSGVIDLRDPGRRPLVPYGASPIGKSLVDWRCFYLGTDDGGNKCKASDQPFGNGFDAIAPEQDVEWGCRQPYLIVIGDGENNCGGENPAADTANLKRNRVQAWVINFGGPENGDLKRLANNTGGQYIAVADRDALRDALSAIVGSIVQDTKAFASAAVPTVQAEEADKIYLSSFTPLNNAKKWPGEIRAFLKPLPTDGSGKPDTSVTCGATPDQDPQSQCFLWDAGTEMLDQVTATFASQLGPGQDQRRIYYSRLSDTGTWVANRSFFNTTADGTAEPIRYDLWRGMGLVSQTTPDDSLDSATESIKQTQANTVVTESYKERLADIHETPSDTSDDTPFVLGDIFHSNPVIVGPPANTRYFALNLDDNTATDPTATCESGRNTGYRCFSLEHQHRRNVLLVGSNDGALHGFDAGIRRASGPFADRTDNGTGKEVFGWVPRPVLNKLKASYLDGLGRTWMVDGNITAADVFIDPENEATPFPNPDQREWRTVAITNLREGGRGYFALDLTQPDAYDANGVPNVATDSYVPTCLGGGSGCGSLSYPSELWEFTDAVFEPTVRQNDEDVPAPHLVSLDEDGNGKADLAQSWSTANIGLVKVCTGVNCDPATTPNDVEDRFVAALGGGLDTTGGTGNAGDWLYLVDIETGKPIYKQKLFASDGVTSGGAAPAEPAAVDTDGDGYLDRVYLGTLKGYLYRADLRGPNGEIPELTDVTPLPTDTSYHEARITDPLFAPHIVFKAQAGPSVTPAEFRPIYYRPAVIFIAQTGEYALAFGVGERSNLFTSPTDGGRFYTFRDDIAVGDTTTFYTEADLHAIQDNSALTDPDQTGNFLISNAVKGWYLVLDGKDRLITSPFALSGVLVFTVFNPNDPLIENSLCSLTGTSLIFGVLATNANGLLFDPDLIRQRSFSIADFVTEPFSELAQTKNPDSNNPDQTPVGQLEPFELQIQNELKGLFPPNCKFASFRIDIKTLSSDTGVHEIAPVPVCIVEKNWREF